MSSASPALSRGRPRLSFSGGGDPHRSPFLYWLGWTLSRWSIGLYFGRTEAGSEHVPASGPVILASNHASFMDPPFVGSSCGRPISYLARESLFSNPVFGWVLRKVGAVPVDRDGASGKGVKTILDRLKGGDGIILFPEGTRTSDGQLGASRAGVGLVVLKSGAPVVPVRVFGTYEAYGRHVKIPRSRRVSIRFGPPLMFSDLRAEAATASRARIKEMYQEVSDQILRAIASLEGPE
ncbi:MAG: 1-acyl-sn-glycerol-3-phosphate acyltransferase [Verrucomicrobiales bacterium]|nr:1-acyl-sn-glycerol-3-phosphate acyltransferase [Verrucomicrobiales bacterium]